MARHFFPHSQPEDDPPVSENTESSFENIFIGSYQECLEFSLVLASQSISSIYNQDDSGKWVLQVESSNAMRAYIEIQEYREENQNHTPTSALPPLLLSAQPLWILIIPFAITIVQFKHLIPGFSQHGMNDAYQTLHGQWWRTITALTLHGNGPHLASNLISGYFVLSLLSGRIPLSRIGPQLFVFSALANFLVAATVQTDFRSLGFSTFVFASLGALATIEWRLLPSKTGMGIFKRAEPLISATFLTIMMGLGEDSDILAHGYGFLCGIITGLIPAKRTLQRNNQTWEMFDSLAILSVYLGVALAWKLALN